MKTHTGTWYNTWHTYPILYLVDYTRTYVARYVSYVLLSETKNFICTLRFEINIVTCCLHPSLEEWGGGSHKENPERLYHHPAPSLHPYTHTKVNNKYHSTPRNSLLAGLPVSHTCITCHTHILVRHTHSWLMTYTTMAIDVSFPPFDWCTLTLYTLSTVLDCARSSSRYPSIRYSHTRTYRAEYGN